MKRIEEMMVTAAENADMLDKKRAPPPLNYATNLTNNHGKQDASDASELSQSTDSGEPGVGHPWPPMAAVLNDGLGGIWVKQDFVDWLGHGLIRNGTYNRVTSLDDCKTQCEALQECRVLKYVRNTQECWLDSNIARTASACERINGQRECISYLKKTQRWDKNYEYGVTSTKDAFWNIVDQQNWLGAGDPKNGGRLIVNGRRNIVETLTQCIGLCAKEKYCRALTFFRPNGECWLSSQAATKGTRCARRMGRRDCVSYVKKKTNPERSGLPAAQINQDGNTQTISVENLGDSQSSTISVNVPGAA